MKFMVLISLLILSSCSNVSTAESEKSVECNIGPIVQSYGGFNWNVYACTDNETLAVVSTEGNPAMPFIFILSPENGKYEVVGSGKSDENVTSAINAIKKARKDLVELDTEEIQKLIIMIKNA